MSRPLVLINSNTVKPPVSPVGLEYVAESVSRAGFEVDIIDLAMEKDWRQAISSSIPSEPPEGDKKKAENDPGQVKAVKSKLAPETAIILFRYWLSRPLPGRESRHRVSPWYAH